MSVSVDNLRRRYPEFSDAFTWSEDTIELFLRDAVDELDAPTWGKLYERGASALAAHLMKIASKSADGLTEGGRISQMKTGDESIAFAPVSAVTSNDGLLSTTKYGEEFLRLKRKVLGFGPIQVW